MEDWIRFVCEYSFLFLNRHFCGSFLLLRFLAHQFSPLFSQFKTTTTTKKKTKTLTSNDFAQIQTSSLAGRSVGRSVEGYRIRQQDSHSGAQDSGHQEGKERCRQPHQDGEHGKEGNRVLRQLCLLFFPILSNALSNRKNIFFLEKKLSKIKFFHGFSFAFTLKKSAKEL